MKKAKIKGLVKYGNGQTTASYEPSQDMEIEAEDIEIIEDKPKGDIRHFDYGYYISSDKSTWPCIYLQTSIIEEGRRIIALGENDSGGMYGEDVNSHPEKYVVLGNLVDIIKNLQNRKET